MTKIGIHIFRRDLRLHDNVALNLLSKEVDKILPIFIFDPFQINHTNENQNYRSDPAVKLMIQSLDDLNDELHKNGSKLFYFNDDPSKVLEKLIKLIKPTHVSYNADFSKYSLKRDKDMDDVCKEKNIELIKFMDDLTLNKMEEFLNKDKVFKVFGAFYKHGIKIKVRNEVKKPINFIGGSTSIVGQYSNDINKFYNKDTKIFITGGRKEALKILKKIKEFKDYENKRDDLTYHTTKLSGYMKFGCVSIVEVYNAMKEGKNLDLLKQLYWRQYFFILARFNYNEYGHVDDFFSKIKWRNDIKEARALWDDAKTGYPVVDAAVRQLQQEGYMHNRGRLIVSSFAVKILQQDPLNWKTYGGQLVFSRLLYDNCYANNYGNWNFTLGPYDLGGFRFGKAGTRGGRVINPTDFKRWDPKLEYVRQYIPELKDVPDKDVSNWYKTYKKYPDIKYPGPIVDYKKRKDEWYQITKK
jgi:deoxyribodipyrimidine photo-lyase